MIFLKNKENWSSSENDVTSEEHFQKRRYLIKSLSLFPAYPIAFSLNPSKSLSDDYSHSSKINRDYILNEKITEESIIIIPKILISVKNWSKIIHPNIDAKIAAEKVMQTHEECMRKWTGHLFEF